jgi:hypothetical protein
MFEGYALFCPFFYAFFLPSFTAILFFSLHPFSSSLSKDFPLFSRMSSSQHFLSSTHSSSEWANKYYRKRDDTKHGEKKEGGGANWRRQKQKVNGSGKGEDRSGKGKKGERARNSDPIN